MSKFVGSTHAEDLEDCLVAVEASNDFVTGYDCFLDHF